MVSGGDEVVPFDVKDEGVEVGLAVAVAVAVFDANRLQAFVTVNELFSRGDGLVPLHLQ